MDFDDDDLILATKGGGFYLRANKQVMEPREEGKVTLYIGVMGA